MPRVARCLVSHAPVLFLVGLPPGQDVSRGGFGGSRRARCEAGSTPGLPVAAVHVVSTENRWLAHNAQPEIFLALAHPPALDCYDTYYPPRFPQWR